MLEVMTPEQTARYVEVLSPEFLNQAFGLQIPAPAQQPSNLNLIG